MSFEPMTPREALLEIRRLAAEWQAAAGREGYHVDWLDRIDGIAKEGLDRHSPMTFELSDQLADRLAQAHQVLRNLDEPRSGAERQAEVAEALALPPDLEAMVERRVDV